MLTGKENKDTIIANRIEEQIGHRGKNHLREGMKANIMSTQA